MAPNDSLEGRLKWSKRAEMELGKELSQIALKNCKAAVAAFAHCATEEGLMVIFNCQTKNKEMNACLKQYTNEVAYEEYKLKRGREIAEQTRIEILAEKAREAARAKDPANTTTTTDA